MHFRICCCCSSDDNEVKPSDATKPSNVEKTTIPTVSAIVTEQPRLADQIQLDRITEASVEESSAQVMKEELDASPPPVRTQAHQERIQENPKPSVSTPPKKFIPTFNLSPNASITTDINGDPFELKQVEQGVYLGIFHDEPFKIKDGELISGPYLETDRELIMSAFVNIATTLENQLETKMDKVTGQPKIGTTINVNITERNGDKYQLPLFVAGPDHYRSKYHGINFAFINGKIVASDEDDYKLDKELLLSNFNLAMQGLLTGLMGIDDTRKEESLSEPNFSSHISARPQFSCITHHRGEELTFNQVEPGVFEVTYKNGQFKLRDGKVIASKGPYTQMDKDAIESAFAQVINKMDVGLNRLESGIDQTMNQPGVGSTIKLKMRERNGELYDLSFYCEAPGRYRSNYRGTPFTIVNGQVVAADGDDYKLNKELLLFTFNRGMKGIEKGLSKMGGYRSQFQASSNGPGSNWQSECIQLLQSLKQRPDDKQVVVDRIMRELDSRMGTEANLSASRDVVDSPDSFDINEPVLKKTTFKANEVNYEEREKYESQDNNEVILKPMNELIISRDDLSGSGNRCYFHEARPRRVNRKKLGPKDQLRLASPERYTLFQMQTLKEHNAYRKNHGVPPLVHNEFLCEVAREWAEHLALKDAFYHRPNNEYGENLYYADRAPYAARRAVKAWYDEIDLYDYNNPGFCKETGHFTQLIWKDTREMGTGAAIVGDKMYVCCNYSPPGNVMGKFNDVYVPRLLMKRLLR